MKLKWLAFLMIGLGVGLTAGVAVLYLLTHIDTQPGAAFNWSGGSQGGLRSGDQAPDFQLEELGGEDVLLRDGRGKVVLINFWATWCPPCREEMPLLQEIYDQHRDSLEILAVNYAEDRRLVEEFVEEYQLTFPVLLDPQEEVNTLYNIRGYPTSVFIDPDGKIRFTHVGAVSQDQLDRYLEKLGIGP